MVISLSVISRCGDRGDVGSWNNRKIIRYPNRGLFTF